MLYVEQSLTAGEKVLQVGRFHWIYLVHASLWLVFGFAMFFAIIGGGMTWAVRGDMHAVYPNLPHNLFWAGWQDIVLQRGGYVTVLRSLNLGVKLIAFFSLLVGVAIFAQLMIIRATTEIAVTSRRLVIKEGVIARRVDEMDIDRIESVHVTQTMFGRILDYGVVMVRGMGVGEIMLPVLAHPIQLRRAIETAKEMGEERQVRMTGRPPEP